MLLFTYDEKLHKKTIREEGREEGRIEMLIDLVRKNKLDISVAAEEANMSEEELKKLL